MAPLVLFLRNGRRRDRAKFGAALVGVSMFVLSHRLSGSAPLLHLPCYSQWNSLKCGCLLCKLASCEDVPNLDLDSDSNTSSYGAAKPHACPVTPSTSFTVFFTALPRTGDNANAGLRSGTNAVRCLVPLLRHERRHKHGLSASSTSVGTVCPCDISSTDVPRRRGTSSLTSVRTATLSNVCMLRRNELKCKSEQAVLHAAATFTAHTAD
ncbi:hypothetical protein AURDEDRAFT_178253 [Auricularia subglabra TFB-10046 SS5]|uniref:Uncharacterized protein n=1 Tax=Auricularia subglabra (strain TFB-10046 / SS5) TaxID=717982 RepID=J0WLJ8_AURST|nr:hypothetical protein AURDEDRAFT_178253 [Auricularia subglabra TFB-10046 SS5]